MNFNYFDHSFCEATIYGSAPEYVNCVSSLFLSLFGFYGLFYTNKNNNINNIYSALIVNGISSFMYHFNNQIGWGLLDRFSMILIAIPCFNIATDMIILNKIIKEIIRLFITIYLSVLMTYTGLHQEFVFNILFGFYLASLGIFILVIKKYNKYYNIPKRIIKHSLLGLLLIFLAAAFWILTEKLCGHYSFIKYMHGHAFWHCGVSYGGYLISLVPYHYYENNNLKKIVNI
jgi:hypothetical protein